MLLRGQHPLSDVWRIQGSSVTLKDASLQPPRKRRERLIRKWGGEREFSAQKSRHMLKQRGQEVGIERFNLDRIASSTFLSHRLVQCDDSQ